MYSNTELVDYTVKIYKLYGNWCTYLFFVLFLFGEKHTRSRRVYGITIYVYENGLKHEDNQNIW